MVVIPEAHRLLLVAQAKEQVIPEPLRAIMLMALLGIALLGLLLVVGTMLGAHWVRRLGSFRRGPAVPKDVAPLRDSSAQRVGNDSGRDMSQEVIDTVVSRDKPGDDTEKLP